MSEVDPGLSIVLTLHREALTAAASLNSVINSARASHCRHEIIISLDCADSETIRVARDFSATHEHTILNVVNFGDPAGSRNSAVGQCSGKYLAIVDGDDLVSLNYFAKHLHEADRLGPGYLIRPELIVTFGEELSFHTQYDERNGEVSRALIFGTNPWASPALGFKEVFQAVPYSLTHANGFGYEDWSWNCELKARGYRNAVANQTAYFYRRKSAAASRNSSSNDSMSILPPNSLFEIRFSE
ncbi:glycosyltransferase [Luteimonas sp. FXH3W]|uniref:Glycosyltransferase n=1 Tax=Aquilutibacter rugosus TaxID=3115820 RepID=A0ABU7UZ07_9GAMM